VGANTVCGTKKICVTDVAVAINDKQDATVVYEISSADDEFITTILIAARAILCWAGA
jgi:hypothetical protein